MAPGPRATALGAPYNEVLNPSFENGLDGWVYNPAVYSGGNPDWGGVVWERSNAWATHRGDWSLRLLATNVSGDPSSTHPFVSFYTEIPVLEGDLVSVGADLNLVQNPRGFNCYLQFFDAAGVELAVTAPSYGFSAVFFTEDGRDLSSHANAGPYVGHAHSTLGYAGLGAPVGAVKMRVWPLSLQGHAGDTYEAFIDNVTMVRNARPVYDDTFATNTIGSYNLQSGTGLSVSGGKLHPTDTSAKLLSLIRPTDSSVLDRFTRVTSKVIFGTTVANYEGSPAFRIDISNTNCVWAGYESGNLRIFERVGGTNTQKGTVAVTVPTAGQTVWISLTAYYDSILGEKVKAEWWTADPALGGAPAHVCTATLTTLAGTSGRAGLYWAGVHASLTSAVDELKIEGWSDTPMVAIITSPQVSFTGYDAGKGWEGEEGASRSGTGTAFADPFVLHPRAQAMLDSIPPVFREDPDVRAILYAQGREAERQEAQLDDLLVQLDPAQATDEGLDWFETLLKTAVSPPGKTVSQRQGTIVNRMSRVAGEPAGSGWETAVSEILGVLGVDWDYAEYVPNPQVNMIHNPKPVSNGFGVMTWWGAGYSNVGAGTAKNYNGLPGHAGGMQVTNNVGGIPGGTAGESMTINTGIMSVTYNDKKWYAFRCVYLVANSVGYGIPTLSAQWSNLSSVVRGTSVLWSGVRNLDLDVGQGILEVSGYAKQPTVGAADTRRLMLYFSFPVITTGATDGNLDFTLADAICTPVEGPSAEIPAWFDGDSKHYQWSSGNVDDDTSQTRTSSTPLVIQIRVPYFAFDPMTDPKMTQVRDLTASHLDMEVLYSEAI